MRGAALAALGLLAVTQLWGGAVTFAQFFETEPSVRGFGWNASARQLTSTGLAVVFRFDSALVPRELAGDHHAHLWLAAVGAQAVEIGGFEVQDFAGTLQILRDSPASWGRSQRTNLLTADFGGVFSGMRNSQTGSLAASNQTGDAVAFTSDFIDFQGETAGMALSFTSLTPTLVKSGNYLRSFTASGTGAFDASFVPEPSLGVVTGCALAVAGLAMRQQQLH